MDDSELLLNETDLCRVRDKSINHQISNCFKLVVKDRVKLNFNILILESDNFMRMMA